MNVIDDKYLGYDVFFEYEDWLIVFDGHYNFMLFDSKSKDAQTRYRKNRVPSNQICPPGVGGASKEVEYYTSFDSALKGLFYVFSGERIGFKEGCIPTYEMGE